PFLYDSNPRACPQGVEGTWRVMAAVWQVDQKSGNLYSVNPTQILTSTSFPGYYETTRSEPIPTSFSFSPDGRTLAMGNMDGSVYLWDITSSKLLRTLPGTPNWVGLLYQIQGMQWSKDGKTLYTGDWDEVVREWDVATGELKRTNSHSEEHSRGHSTYVDSY